MIARDGAGRPVSGTDPVGFSTNSEFSTLDQVTRVVDPAVGETRFTYDAQRNLTDVTNPNGVASIQRLPLNQPVITN